MGKKVVSARKVQASDPQATDVEILNAAKESGAEVDWAGYVQPVHVNESAPGTPADPNAPFNKRQAYEQTPRERATGERRSKAAFSWRGIASGAANFLPAIGGDVAGAVAGAAAGSGTGGVAALPVAMAAHAVGSGAGEAARMGVRGLLGLPNPPNKVQSILTQAALGSTVPVASRAINAGRTAIGEQMYRGALSPKPSAIRDYPDLIEYGQKNAQAEVTKIGGGRAQTADRIEKEMAHDVKVLHDALTDASKAGHTVKLARITEALHRLRNSHLPAAGAVGSDSERAAEKILEEISKLRRSLPRDVPLDLAQLTKQNSADRASALYDAMKGAGGAADMDSPTMEKIHKTIADVIRNQVRAIPVHGEKIEAANKALQADMALVKALKDASLKGDPKFSPDFTKPASLYPITRNTESKLGIMAEKPAVKIAGEGAARISALFPWLNSPNKERKPKEESK